MAKPNKQKGSSLVYSTDPGFKGFEADESDTAKEFLAPGEQPIRVRLETKHRAGKAVTLVEQYDATEADKIELGKKLKAFCGTGGSVKDGEILVQGDHRTKILQWLQKNGFKKAKIAG